MRGKLRTSYFVLLTCSAAAFAAAEPWDLDNWSLSFGGKEGVVFEKVVDGDGAVTGWRVVEPPTATNRIEIRSIFAKTPFVLTPYQCMEMTLKSDHDFSGGDFLITANGWTTPGGGSVPIGGSYKSRAPNSWSWQRGGLIGVFHRGRDQEIALQVNPREKIPAGKTVTVRANLANIYAKTPGRECMMFRVALPPNRTGETNTVEITGFRILDEIPDDPVWLPKAKEADAALASLRTDYSDSSWMLDPPATNRFEKPFAVVRDGKPAAEIVLAPETAESPVLRTAAEELQRWIREITGVELPIRADGSRKPGVGGVQGLVLGETELNRILVGKRLVPSYRDCGWFANDGWNEILARLSGRDGYAIRLDPANPRNLHVFGALDKGTLNGVFALLENNTDIIWSRPNEKLGTVFTKTPGELSFVWGDEVVDVPDGESRGWNSFKGVEWMARNKCNLFNGGGGGDIEWAAAGKAKWGVLYRRHLGGHNIFHFLKGETDPLLFAHNDAGERTGGNPCFTSPQMLEAFASNVLNCARMAPDGTRRLYINTQDTWKQCQCSNCLAPIRLDDGTVIENTAENFRSTQYWMFMNKVAERLAAEMPGMGIVSLAYFFTAPPPACRLHPNLVPEFAPYVRTNDKTPIFAPENASWMKRLVGWSKVCPTVETYDYYGLGLGFPRPLAEVRAFDFAMMHPYVFGMTSEENSFRDEPGQAAEAIWDVSAMEHWVLTKLYWDPRQDVESLRKRYIRRAFREAAPAVEKVYGAIREEWFKSPRASTLGDNPVDLAKSLLVDTGRAASVSNLLDEAVAAAVHPKSKILAERLRLRLMGFIDEAASLKNPMAQLPLMRPETAPGFDDSVWARGALLEPFALVSKTDRARPPKYATEARAFHDAERLHIRLRCADPSLAALKRHEMPVGKKELIPEDDHVEIFVTDAAEEGAYYLFSVSPDDLAADYKGYDGDWNGDWKHRARRRDDGYDILLSIPLSTFHADAASRDAFKLLVLRQTHPHGETTRENSSWGGGWWHLVSTFGDVRLLH